MQDAQSITRALGGRWHGRYGSAPCPAHEDRRPSLSVTDGTDGRLLAYCHTGCTFRDVLDALRGLGLAKGAGEWARPRGDDLEALRRRWATRKAEAKADAEKAAWAERCWAETRPIAGTLAERYLRSRGIACELPPSLRFHPRSMHRPSRRRLPAMIARVEGADAAAIHRTFLSPKGGKAEVSPNRMMLGAVRGGAVRLAEGPGPLVVAEGIETALSLMSGLLSQWGSVWATLSAVGMGGLRLPSEAGELVVAIDSDDVGAGLREGRALARRAAALGWKVSTLPAPRGRDWNDVLAERVER